MRTDVGPHLSKTSVKKLQKTARLGTTAGWVMLDHPDFGPLVRPQVGSPLALQPCTTAWFGHLFSFLCFFFLNCLLLSELLYQNLIIEFSIFNSTCLNWLDLAASPNGYLALCRCAQGAPLCARPLEPLCVAAAEDQLLELRRFLEEGAARRKIAWVCLEIITGVP